MDDNGWKSARNGHFVSYRMVIDMGVNEIENKKTRTHRIWTEIEMENDTLDERIII